jgi:hypothetical protein
MHCTRSRYVGWADLRLLAAAAALGLLAACNCPQGVVSETGSDGVSNEGGEQVGGDPEAYYLPFEAGTTVWVGQGYLGVLSHAGEYAADFMTPLGTPIVAARGGTVVDLNEASDCNSWTVLGPDHADPDCYSNFVQIRHGDDTIAVYGHLLHDSVSVEIGQTVARGEAIALSGHTGFSFLPHLHFAVSNPPTAARFADVCGDGIPQAGYSYTSQNARGAN